MQKQGLGPSRVHHEQRSVEKKARGRRSGTCRFGAAVLVARGLGEKHRTWERKKGEWRISRVPRPRRSPGLSDTLVPCHSALSACVPALLFRVPDRTELSSLCGLLLQTRAPPPEFGRPTPEICLGLVYLKKFAKKIIIVLSFVFDKYYPIID